MSKGTGAEVLKIVLVSRMHESVVMSTDIDIGLETGSGKEIVPFLLQVIVFFQLNEERLYRDNHARKS